MAKRPLNVMFCLTSMPVGGAETLLASLVRNFDPSRILPQICCLKEPARLGEEIAQEFPLHSQLIRHKYDVRVLSRLRRLFQQEQIDAMVTVGAGDKMFWGRIAARWAKVPVVLAALHSTGWPDGVGRLNRILTPWTDGFIGVAQSHGKFLREHERFPAEKVFVIRNGIDTDRFQFSARSRANWRKSLGITEQDPVVGIVAALRPEKNHRLFLQAASATIRDFPRTRFLIAGEGPLRADLEVWASDHRIAHQVHFLGNVADTPGFLSALDVFALTSDNEASPVSIVEASACRLPVVATDVGSVSELVRNDDNGYLTHTGDASAIAAAWGKLLGNPQLRADFGARGRAFVEANASLTEMVRGYTELIECLCARKQSATLEQTDGATAAATTGSQPSSLTPSRSPSDSSGLVVSPDREPKSDSILDSQRPDQNPSRPTSGRSPVIAWDWQPETGSTDSLSAGE